VPFFSTKTSAAAQQRGDLGPGDGAIAPSYLDAVKRAASRNCGRSRGNQSRTEKKVAAATTGACESRRKDSRNSCLNSAASTLVLQETCSK